MEWRKTVLVLSAFSICFYRGSAFVQRNSAGFVRNAPFKSTLATFVTRRRRTSLLPVSNDDDLLDLHRTVAREDAEWYQRFVADVLGEEMPVLAAEIELTQNTSRIEPTETRETDSRETSNTSPTMEVKKSLNETIGLKIDSRKGSDYAVEQRKSTSTPTSGKGADSPAPKAAAPLEEIPLMQTNKTIVKARNETIADSPNNTAASVQDSTINHSGSNADDRSEENDADKLDLIQKQQQNASQTALHEEQSVNSTATAVNENVEDRTVLYRDLYTASLKAVSLSEMNSLGYTADEIPYLQPDALALIVSDKIKRPTRGVPRQWMISDSQYQILSEDVRIVSTSEATSILDTARQKKRRNVVEPQQKGPEADRQSEPTVERNRSDSRQNATALDELDGKPRRASRREERRRSVKPVEDRQTTGRRRVRAARDEAKRIYNARGSPRKRRAVDDDDPPPPKGPLWVDVDTFRNLLRREAELRVRILGEDWADVVKEESNWRLRLYKEWLWTLDRGWGSPLIPSRSERGQISNRGRRRARSVPRDGTRSTQEEPRLSRRERSLNDGYPDMRNNRRRFSEDVANGNGAENFVASGRRPRSYEATSRRSPRGGP